MISRLELPLFPLNVVHFPSTALRLHIFEPRYRQLVEDLSVKTADERLIGMLPVCESDLDGPPVVSPAGTAGRLVEVEPLPEQRFDIELYGAFRFRVEQELEARPYRRAIVQPCPEPAIDFDSTVVKVLDSDLRTLVREVATETGDRFPMSEKRLRELLDETLEVLINSIAADLDLPTLRKLHLLNQPLAERGGELIRILSGRKKVLQKLRPFRHLVSDPSLN